jgi:hypothetical protein
MKRFVPRLLVVEALLCFTLPMYFLFWGLISAPLWTAGLGRGAPYLWWYVFDVVGGLLGVIGIVILLRHSVADTPPRAFRAARVGALVVAGLLAAWQAPSNTFSEISLDLGTFLMAILPTLCAVHLYLLALLRSRRQRPLRFGPNKTMEPTR